MPNVLSKSIVHCRLVNNIDYRIFRQVSNRTSHFFLEVDVNNVVDILWMMFHWRTRINAFTKIHVTDCNVIQRHFNEDIWLNQERKKKIAALSNRPNTSPFS